MDRTRILVYEFFFAKLQFAENDLIQLENNLNCRAADYLDHLEFILAKNRYDVLYDIFQDLSILIREMGRDC